MRAFLLLGLVVALAGCGRPTSPSASTADVRFAILAPASASLDLPAMFTEAGAAQWAQARSKLRGFQFYQQSLRNWCTSCGTNTVARMLEARPGGAFRWLSQNGIQIGVEAGAIKEHTCDGRALAQVALSDMAPIYSSGSHVTFVAMDEPFAAALPGRAELGLAHCDFSIDQAVVEVQRFTDAILSVHPSIRVGLIEPYPFFTVDEIFGFIGALENAGVQIPFFRLDFDLRHRLNEEANSTSDLRRLRDFLAGRGIDFEVIVTGYDGRTDAESVASAMALAYEVSGAIGRPFAVVFQDWSSDRLGLVSGAVNLPETTVGSLTWLLNNGVDVFR